MTSYPLSPRNRPSNAESTNHPHVSLMVVRCRMRGRLVSATSPSTARVFIARDATAREIGRAILAGARAIAEHRQPGRHDAEQHAAVIPLQRRGDHHHQEVERGLG